MHQIFVQFSQTIHFGSNDKYQKLKNDDKNAFWCKFQNLHFLRYFQNKRLSKAEYLYPNQN